MKNQRRRPLYPEKWRIYPAQGRQRYRKRTRSFRWMPPLYSDRILPSFVIWLFVALVLLFLLDGKIRWH